MRLVVFSLPQSPTATAPSQRGPRRLTPRRADCHASLRIATPVCGLARNDTSSVNASRCHLPLKGKAGGFRALRARVAFFYCQKKATKENHLDLRSKNPLARGETFLAGNFPTRPRRFFRFFSSVRRTVPAQLPAWRCRAPLAGATVGVLRSIVFGDYQTAPKPPGGRLWEVRPRARGYIREYSVKISLRNRQFS